LRTCATRGTCRARCSGRPRRAGRPCGTLRACRSGWTRGTLWACRSSDGLRCPATGCAVPHQGFSAAWRRGGNGPSLNLGHGVCARRARNIAQKDSGREQRPGVHRGAAVQVQSGGCVGLEIRLVHQASRRKNSAGLEWLGAGRTRKVDALALCSKIHECLSVGHANQPSHNQNRTPVLHEYVSLRAEFSTQVYQHEIGARTRSGR